MRTPMIAHDVFGGRVYVHAFPSKGAVSRVIDAGEAAIFRFILGRAYGWRTVWS